MAQNTNRILSIGFLIIVWFIAFIIFFLAFLQRSQFIICRDTESPYCYSMTCSEDGVNGLTATCGHYAYRCNDDGTVSCSDNPYIKKKPDPRDNICIPDVNFDLCKE